jgi:fatty-acyl-CoA synthase
MLPVRFESRFESLRTTALAALDKARVLSRVGLSTGMVWEVRPKGAFAALRVLLASSSQNISHIYRIHGENGHDRPAIVFGDTTYSYADVDAHMSRIARGLERRGLGRGRSLLIVLKNRPELILANGGGARFGVKVVTASWRSSARELAYLAQHAKVGAVVFEDSVAPAVDEALRDGPEVPPELRFVVGEEVEGATPFADLLREPAYFPLEAEAADGAAIVMYTSGTTGKPKGAVRRFQRGGLAAWADFIAITPMRSDDVHLAVCPLYHATGMGFLGMTHLLGGTVVILPEFTPEAFVEATLRHRVTTTAVVPTMLHRVMGLGLSRLPSPSSRTLRAIFVGGAPLPGPLGTAVMDAFGDVLFNFYGATETGLVTLASPRDLRAAPWTIGPPVPGVSVRILDDAGNEVPRGEVGELFAKSETLVDGYHDDDKATRDSMKEGYFSVGDLARQDAEGRIFLAGRKRDMIISGGVNVYPAEVEAVLESHPDVAEAAVIGAPDEELGEKVMAFVVAKPGVGAAELEARLGSHCRTELAGPKRPRVFRFVEALPRNPTGKVLKRELREQV